MSLNQESFERALRDAPVWLSPETGDVAIGLPSDIVGIVIPRHGSRAAVPGGYVVRFDREEIADLAADALLDPNQDAPVVKRKIALLRRLVSRAEWAEIEAGVEAGRLFVRDALDLPPGMEPAPVV